MKSPGSQASTKCSHPRQPGSAFLISWHCTWSGGMWILFLGSWDGDILLCGRPWPLHSSWHAPRANHVVFLWQLGLAAIGLTADYLDASALEPVKQGFQYGAKHCADLIPDDHMGNELLSHPFEHPFCLATWAEEAVIGLGLHSSGLYILCWAMVWVKMRGFMVWKSTTACVVLRLPPLLFRWLNLCLDGGP